MNYLFLVLVTTSILLRPQAAHAQMDAKAKAFLTILGYGTAGGAILGMASTAFGMSARAIPQGASLGLYAGILFGGYVLVSHHNKQYGSYDDNASPYGEANDIYSDDYQSDDGGGTTGSGKGGFFDRFQVIQEKFHGQSFTLGEKPRGSRMPPLKVNLLNYEF